MSSIKQFDLNLHDVDLIVKCLRREIGAVSSRTFNNQHPWHNEAKADLDLIQSVLGKLHKQKPILLENSILNLIKLS